MSLAHPVLRSALLTLRGFICLQPVGTAARAILAAVEVEAGVVVGRRTAIIFSVLIAFLTGAVEVVAAEVEAVADGVDKEAVAEEEVSLWRSSTPL